MEFMRPAPRYDGHAQWYDEWRATYIADNAADIVGLLGPGSGLCLDLGCGTGLLFPALAGTGRSSSGWTCRPTSCGSPAAGRAR